MDEDECIVYTETDDFLGNVETLVILEFQKTFCEKMKEKLKLVSYEETVEDNVIKFIVQKIGEIIDEVMPEDFPFQFKIVRYDIDEAYDLINKEWIEL